MIAAGRFRSYGVIQRVKSDATVGASGRVDLTSSSNWTEIWNGHMEVIDVSMRERIYSQQVVPQGTVRVTVRLTDQTSKITPKDRVLLKCRTLNINGIVRIGNPARLLELECVEQV